VELVLLPGMDGTARLFRRLSNALPAAWKKTALPYPADAPVAYEQLLRMVHSEAPSGPFLLVAESYSTPLAIRYAATQPRQLLGLVLCAGFASCPLRGWQRFAVKLFRPILFRLPLTQTAIQQLLLGRAASADLVSELRTALAAIKPEVLAGRLGHILACDVRADLAKIRVPALYLQARSDRLVGRQSLAEIQQIMPNILVKRIPGPHLLLHRQPEQAAKAILEFVLRVSQGAVEEI